MNVFELLKKNDLVITVDGDLRFAKDCYHEGKYNYHECKYEFSYYGHDKYVVDYDGEYLDKDTIEDSHFCKNDEWYNIKRYAICEKCGYVRDIEDLHETIDTGRCICGDCATQCDDCGGWYEDSDDMCLVEHRNTYICRDCYDNHYITCSDCGEVVHIDDACWVGDDPVCDWCREAHYSWCERCDSWVHNNDFNFDTDYCNNCSDEDGDCSNGFHFIQYSTKPAPVFYGTTKRADKGEDIDDMGVGFELEITTTSGSSDSLGPRLVDIVGPHCYYKRDCSCSSGRYRDEIEIIGHPMKYDYFMNEFPWDDVCKTALQEQYVSHDYNPAPDKSCGFHLHFSRPYFGSTRKEQIRTAAKLEMLFDIYWEDLIKVSRRKSKMLHWSEINIIRGDDSFKDFYLRCRKDYLNYVSHSDRYYAINFTNEHTYEIRLCRGSLNPKALKAWADLMFVMIHNCRTLSILDLKNNPKKFLDGITSETREYLTEKNAFVEC